VLTAGPGSFKVEDLVWILRARPWRIVWWMHQLSKAHLLVYHLTNAARQVDREVREPGRLVVAKAFEVGPAGACADPALLHAPHARRGVLIARASSAAFTSARS
jgi:hypothetical protein